MSGEDELLKRGSTLSSETLGGSHCLGFNNVLSVPSDIKAPQTSTRISTVFCLETATLTHSRIAPKDGLQYIVAESVDSKGCRDGGASLEHLRKAFPGSTKSHKLRLRVDHELIATVLTVGSLLDTIPGFRSMRLFALCAPADALRSQELQRAKVATPSLVPVIGYRTPFYNQTYLAGAC
jgi:hypothetical protein